MDKGLVMSASSSAPTTNIPHPVVIGYETANAPRTNICTGLQSSFISVEQGGVLAYRTSQIPSYSEHKWNTTRNFITTRKVPGADESERPEPTKRKGEEDMDVDEGSADLGTGQVGAQPQKLEGMRKLPQEGDYFPEIPKGGVLAYSTSQIPSYSEHKWNTTRNFITTRKVPGADESERPEPTKRKGEEDMDVDEGSADLGIGQVGAQPQQKEGKKRKLESDHILRMGKQKEGKKKKLAQESAHIAWMPKAFYTGTEFLKPNNSLGNDEGPSVPAALETGQVVAQLQTLEEENKVLKAKLRELEKNLKREERIREKEDEVRITKKATRNCRTEEELRNKKRELERIKVDLERTHYAKRTAEEVKVLSPEVQRCEVRINEVKEEWSGAKGKVMRGKVRDIEVVVKEPLSTKRKDFKAFKRESDIISQLDHPNVVRCHATFDEHYNQSPWIVLEYANGVSLGYHLNKRLFTLVPFEVLSFALDAGRGLLYLHTLPSPIVHGDLHSGNLLLFTIGSTPPVLKLCDFGKATVLGNTMPPNQGPSKKDDVLSFGKLLLDMLRKIKWPDWMAHQKKVYFITFLEQLIERCMNNIPESRPSMQEVVDDLKDLENSYSNFPGRVEQDLVEKYVITETSFNRH